MGGVYNSLLANASSVNKQNKNVPPDNETRAPHASIPGFPEAVNRLILRQTQSLHSNIQEFHQSLDYNS